MGAQETARPDAPAIARRSPTRSRRAGPTTACTPIRSSRSAGGSASWTFIVAFHERQPADEIVITSLADERHGFVRFAWRWERGDRTTIKGVDFGQLDPSGRLQRITGFFGPPRPR